MHPLPVKCVGFPMCACVLVWKQEYHCDVVIEFITPVHSPIPLALHPARCE